ncbi:hypothetical protein XENORESO_014740 [Xenotaenia resolanae]|uniref:Uncharacterized protein n=1 Tax=Xenotaenia resolanae TaxID=208358 RepID=A0ABV0WM03_9TELE
MCMAMQTMCIRALRAYLDRISSFRRSDQLFVSWAKPFRQRPSLSLDCWSNRVILYTSRGFSPLWACVLIPPVAWLRPGPSSRGCLSRTYVQGELVFSTHFCSIV